MLSAVPSRLTFPRNSRTRAPTRTSRAFAENRAGRLRVLFILELYIFRAGMQALLHALLHHRFFSHLCSSASPKISILSRSSTDSEKYTKFTSATNRLS